MPEQHAAASWAEQPAAVAADADAAGQVVSEVLVPRDLWDGDKSGLYRATPYDSVGGELGASPFDADGAASPPGDGDGGGHDLSHPPRMAAV